VPIVLIDLITIYDDEESSKVLRITLVPITQEEVPGETSAPITDVLIPNPHEGDHKARSTLDIEFLDQLGTHPQNASSKNVLGVGEQEDEMEKPEINTSMAKLPANFDPSPTSLVRTKNLSVNED
jgi:hypothetical protein